MAPKKITNSRTTHLLYPLRNSGIDGKIHVVTPIRNRVGANLIRHLESISIQKKMIGHWWLVDHGSSKESAEWMDGIAANFDGLEVHHIMTQDSTWCKSEAINYALRRFPKDGISMTVDADMVLHPDHMAKALEIHRQRASFLVFNCISLPPNVIDVSDYYELKKYAVRCGSPGIKECWREDIGPSFVGWGGCQSAPSMWWKWARGMNESFKMWGSHDHDTAMRAERSGLFLIWAPSEYSTIHQYHLPGQKKNVNAARWIARNSKISRFSSKNTIANKKESWGVWP